MDENKNELKQDERPGRGGARTPAKQKKKEGGFSVPDFFKNIIGEFRLVIWPDRPTLVKHTITVIIVSGIIGAVII